MTTSTWAGTTGDWSTAGNWSGGIPNSATDVVFNSVGGVSSKPSVGGSAAANTVTLNNSFVGVSGNLSISHALTLNGSYLLMSGGSVNASAVSTTATGAMSWIDGFGTINSASAVSNSSIGVQSSGGTLRFTGAFDSYAEILSGSTLELASSQSAQVNFTSSTGTLKLDNPATFFGHISQFSTGDIIDLAGISVASMSYNSGTLAVTQTNGQSFNLLVAGNITGNTFVSGSDGAGGTKVFLSGSTDVIPPVLTSFAFPANINVENGTSAALLTIGASDNVGVRSVQVDLDQTLSTSLGVNNFFLVQNLGASPWVSGTQSVTETVLTSNASGTYHVADIKVTDLAGNIKIYSPSELTQIGVSTSFNLNGGQAKQIPTVAGTDANDRLTIGVDVGTVNGGNGLDVLLLNGAHSDYNLNVSSALVTISKVAAGISYSIISVERIQYNDEIIALDTLGNAGQAYRMYQAAFARTPDKNGVSYWVSQVDKGLNLHDLGQAFIGSAEFKSIFGSSPTVDRAVTGFYTNVLGRAPDSSGLSYWVGQVQSGLSTADLLVSFSESAENKAHLTPAIQNGIELSLSYFA